MSATILRTAKVFVPFVDEDVVRDVLSSVPVAFHPMITMSLTDTAERAQKFAKENVEKELGYFERVSRTEAFLSTKAIGFNGWMVSLDITED